MHVLSIDVGSYSVKYISSFVDKRKINHVDMSEIILRDYLNDHSDMTELEAQIAIVQDVIDSNARAETKIIFQADNEMMTTRFLTLPVKSKKKAELMLPFQLEEDIPYTLNEIHYSYRMEAQKTQHTAIVELAKETSFEPYYNLLKDKNSIPNILTTESSGIENFFNQNTIAGPFCVLDLGHKTTKAYFFYNSRLLSSHISYVGGHDINQMIAETYKIDQDEAIIYKHQNAFLLTSAQMSEVESTQREFAEAMDKVLSSLVTDFIRWKIGFKVNFGISIQNVFIMGGSSNIKNIASFLTEKWDTKVALLESFDKVESEKIDLNAKNKSKFALTNMFAIGIRRKNRFINLLSGKFTQASLTELPLHSFSFIGVRVAAVTAVFLLSLVAERVFIERDIKAVNAKITSLMKNDELQISGRIRRGIANDPKPLYDTLVKKQRGVRQEISTLQAAVDIKALSPLLVVSQVAASTQATLIDFSSSDTGEIKCVFTAQDATDLNNLKAAFERSSLADINVQVDQANLQLTVMAQDN